MKRFLLTIVLAMAVSAVTGACRGSAEVGNPYRIHTVKTRRAVKCKQCTAFRCDKSVKKRRYARR